MPNLIHLKDYSDQYKVHTVNYPFIKAEATQSRLMGVVGVKLHFEDLMLYCHLDFEEYGFDRFEYMKKPNEVEDMMLTESIMGGLGADKVEITLKEATALIYQAIDVGATYGYEVPLEFFEYEYLLEDTMETLPKESYEKLCQPIETHESLINYFLMRTAGLDHSFRKCMLQEGDFDFEFLDEPTVLLKNEVIDYMDHYICQSIIDYFDAYKMIVTRVKVENNKVISCELIEELVMTPKEASFQLNKNEYIMLFYVPSAKGFKLEFEPSDPSMMRNLYESGTLYTAFNKDNHHVDDKCYYLNGDVYASYFVTDDNQIVVSCFDHDNLVEIQNRFKEEYQIEMMAELEAENPILYRFVSSGFKDFFDFLGE